MTTTITNESGAYNFPSLLPGRYTISASLPGFQTRTLTDLQLGQGTSYRYNFALTVASVATQVEVSVSGQDVLATSGATIGQVLDQQRVSDLPMVGNNVLQLISVLSGVENATDATFGREGTTFAGISASNITTVRDGIMVQDTRWPTGINSATVINPDLVGEVRLILAPVDAEIGRGNGTVQIQTRSGTNPTPIQFHYQRVGGPPAPLDAMMKYIRGTTTKTGLHVSALLNKRQSAKDKGARAPVQGHSSIKPH